MQTDNLKRLIAVMALSRLQQQENRRHLRHTLFEFQTGLSRVKHRMQHSAKRFAELTGGRDETGEMQAMELYRKAS